MEILNLHIDRERAEAYGIDRVPAIAVARSCCIVPMTSPIAEILNDEARLGSMA